MRSLFVADPLTGLHADVDATVGLMAAAQDLDQEVWCCTPEDLAVVDGRVRALARHVVLHPRRPATGARWAVPERWWEESRVAWLDVAADCALVHLRIDPPVDGRYLRTTYVLDLVDASGTPVVNRPSGVRAVHEKLCVLGFPDLAPPTLVSARVHDLRDFVAEIGCAVVKPVDGFAGRDVWLVRDDRAATALLESATCSGTRHVIAQQYLDRVELGNKRLFLLDGEILGAVRRRPSHGDFRIGAPDAAADVDDADRAIEAALGPLLRRHGIGLAGVDVIDGRLIEVNVTCPGGMHKADALLGTDLSGAVLRHLTTRHTLEGVTS